MTYSAINNFYDVYSRAIDEGESAIFAGAGLSQPAGYVNRKELLRDIAAELDLDIDKELGRNIHVSFMDHGAEDARGYQLVEQKVMPGKPGDRTLKVSVYVPPWPPHQPLAI